MMTRKLISRPALPFFLVVLAAFAGPTGGRAEADSAKEGFVSLFDGQTLAGWRLMNGADFAVKEGVIQHRSGLGWLRSEKQYADFVLRLEFRFLRPKQDGGVFLRTGLEGERWPDQRYEVQIENTERMAKVFRAPYELDIERTRRALKPDGEWNAYEIRLVGPKLEVRLNGELVTTSTALAHARGYIGLQGENGAHDYRSICIKEL